MRSWSCDVPKATFLSLVTTPLEWTALFRPPSCARNAGGTKPCGCWISKFMTEKEQTDHFADDIDALVNRYRSEYDMSYAAVVGVLAMKMHLLCAEAARRAGELE